MVRWGRSMVLRCLDRERAVFTAFGGNHSKQNEDLSTAMEYPLNDKHCVVWLFFFGGATRTNILTSSCFGVVEYLLAPRWSRTRTQRRTPAEEQIGDRFHGSLQLRSSDPQRIVIDYSSPNIAKVGFPRKTPVVRCRPYGAQACVVFMFVLHRVFLQIL